MRALFFSIETTGVQLFLSQTTQLSEPLSLACGHLQDVAAGPPGHPVQTPSLA